MQDSHVLEIFVSTDLSSLRFQTDGELLGIIEKPLLLWECSCDPVSGGRSPQNGPCRLHSLPGAATISELFGLNTIIWYRDIPVVWNGQASWPPSIDAWFFVKTLIEYSWPSAETNRLWDIGAGTGFLGIQLANISNQLEQVIAVEIDPLAADLCSINFARVGPQHIGWEILVEDARHLEPARIVPADAIVSAPPYIPNHHGSREEIPGPAVGLSLIEALLALVKNSGSQLMLLYSSVAKPEVKQILASLDLNEDVLAQYSIPFRVGLSPFHLEWLISRDSLKTLPKSVFAYWHDIWVVSINKQKG